MHAVTGAWLEGTGCAQELWEKEKPAKVKCVCWVDGGHLTSLSTGEGCISEDHCGAHMEDGLDGAAWSMGDQGESVRADLGHWQWRWEGEKL